MISPILYYPEADMDQIQGIGTKAAGDFTDILAKSIAEAALKAGFYNGEVALDGPQLLMFLDEMATHIVATKVMPPEDVKKAVALAEKWGDWRVRAEDHERNGSCSAAIHTSKQVLRDFLNKSIALTE